MYQWNIITQIVEKYYTIRLLFVVLDVSKNFE